MRIAKFRMGKPCCRHAFIAQPVADWAVARTNKRPKISAAVITPRVRATLEEYTSASFPGYRWRLRLETQAFALWAITWWFKRKNVAMTRGAASVIAISSEILRHLGGQVKGRTSSTLSVGSP